MVLSDKFNWSADFEKKGGSSRALVVMSEIETTTVKKFKSQNASKPTTSVSKKTDYYGGCFPVSCSKDNKMTFKTRGESFLCDANNKKVAFYTNSAVTSKTSTTTVTEKTTYSIICPSDLVDFCEHSTTVCPDDCNGRGYCRKKTKKCKCLFGFTGPSCAEREKTCPAGAEPSLCKTIFGIDPAKTPTSTAPIVTGTTTDTKMNRLLSTSASRAPSEKFPTPQDSKTQ